MKVGIIGWRGMVGSVLMDRMKAESDFADIEVEYFSTSNAGGEGPEGQPLLDAFDLKSLKAFDALITCQGGGYTSDVYPKLRSDSWNGYWIDAASTLRMDKDAIIILDPINLADIQQGLTNGIKTFAGGNCTVSLMLMGIGELFKQGWIEWLSSMTYQAASGGGAAHMKELVQQCAVVNDQVDLSATALSLEAKVSETINSPDFPKDAFGHSLAYSLLPFIDREVELGQSKEEWKGIAETNKILKANPQIPVDGICVRVGSLRCHSQAFTIKLKKDIPITDIEAAIRSSNDWVKVIENTKEASLKELAPAKVSGTMSIPVGRLRKMHMGPEYLSAFSVGDQLLWGAAEPLRRMLRIILDYKS